MSGEIRGGVAARISQFLDSRAPVVEAIAVWAPPDSESSGGPADELDLVRRLAAEMTAGGKRLRPAFALWGCVAAAGVEAVDTPVWTAAAALDLLHVSALVHDDVMDGSDLRRGQPAAHKQFETHHREQSWLGDPAQFGRAGAILLGDLLVMWSAEMIDSAGLAPEALARALPVLHAVRTEVTLGQYLDVVAQARPPRGDLESEVLTAQRVVEHKSAKYSVQRPVLFGAQLGGAGPEVLMALEIYGSALGRAFQYRDDVLGVFGDESVTGKPAGDDLREGKRTLLVAHTRAGLDPATRQRFDSLFGRPDLDEAARRELQGLVTRSGARTDVEAMITRLHDEAVAALGTVDLTADGREALTRLARAAVERDF